MAVSKQISGIGKKVKSVGHQFLNYFLKFLPVVEWSIIMPILIIFLLIHLTNLSQELYRYIFLSVLIPLEDTQEYKTYSKLAAFPAKYMVLTAFMISFIYRLLPLYFAAHMKSYDKHFQIFTVSKSTLVLTEKKAPDKGSSKTIKINRCQHKSHFQNTKW